MFGKRSTPTKDLTSELEQVPGHWAVAAHCCWVVKMGQMHKTKSSKESNKEEVHQWSHSKLLYQAEALFHVLDGSQACESQYRPWLCLDSTHPPPQHSLYPDCHTTAWQAFPFVTVHAVCALDRAALREFFIWRGNEQSYRCDGEDKQPITWQLLVQHVT